MSRKRVRDMTPRERLLRRLDGLDRTYEALAYLTASDVQVDPIMWRLRRSLAELRTIALEIRERATTTDREGA